MRRQKDSCGSSQDHTVLENKWRETSLQSFVCFPGCQPFESVPSEQSSTFQNENIQYCLMKTVCGRSTNKRRSRMRKQISFFKIWIEIDLQSGRPTFCITQTFHISGGTVPTPSPSRERLHKPVLTTGHHSVNHKMFLFQNNQSNKTKKN